MESLNTSEQESGGETIAGENEDEIDESDAPEDEQMESDDDYDIEEDMESEEEASEFIAKLVQTFLFKGILFHSKQSIKSLVTKRLRYSEHCGRTGSMVVLIGKGILNFKFYQQKVTVYNMQ